ncbi:MAG TPA: wax ester/triacylglycerol synthase domain-containing protein [Acidimicrobiales bacterium]|nr:wax ester/triacylglycerol synthase domain-containing protein [Acidimicrobiales bacterium]
MPPLRFERRMSDTEALMWALEDDPVLRSTFANVTFLDRMPDVERFRERMLLAIEALPRLRQRVSDPPGIANPEWVDDPFFDLDFHVRRVGAPAPGDERAVLDLAARLSLDPFDRARPLWQFTVVEGMADGRAAMVQKLHHTITDGEGGVRLSAMFLDLARDATEPLGGVPEPAIVEREGGSSAVDAVRSAVRVPLGMARGGVDALTGGNPVEMVRSVLRQLAVSEPARSPLWCERSLRRHLEILSIPLDRTKAAAGALGGSVNDLFVCGAAGAAGAYHRAKGATVDELRMAMPISTRTDKGAGGNAFTPTRMLVPVGIEDPEVRFAAIRDAINVTKTERAVGLASSVAGLLSPLPNQLLTRFARQQVGTVDFTTSNVRGAPFELFICGARIEGNYPIGPMAGTAFNLTTLSFAGNLDMGCVIDTAAIDDPALLKACLVESFDELLAYA